MSTQARDRQVTGCTAREPTLLALWGEKKDLIKIKALVSLFKLYTYTLVFLLIYFWQSGCSRKCPSRPALLLVPVIWAAAHKGLNLQDYNCSFSESQCVTCPSWPRLPFMLQKSSSTTKPLVCMNSLDKLIQLSACQTHNVTITVNI